MKLKCGQHLHQHTHLKSTLNRFLSPNLETLLVRFKPDRNGLEKKFWNEQTGEIESNQNSVEMMVMTETQYFWSSL